MSVEGCPLGRLPPHVVDGGPSAIIQVGFQSCAQVTYPKSIELYIRTIWRPPGCLLLVYTCSCVSNAACCGKYNVMLNKQFVLTLQNLNQYIVAVHLLATDCTVATNCITLPYKIVYLDSKMVAASMHGYNYNQLYLGKHCLCKLGLLIQCTTNQICLHCFSFSLDFARSVQYKIMTRFKVTIVLVDAGCGVHVIKLGYGCGKGRHDYSGNGSSLIFRYVINNVFFFFSTPQHLKYQGPYRSLRQFQKQSIIGFSIMQMQRQTIYFFF